MKQIYLIRHAQSESNAGLAIRPNHEIDLTALGHQQAADTAQWLYHHIPNPHRVFVSSMIRTHKTAAPYLTRIQQSAHTMDDLSEFNYLDYARIRHVSFDALIAMAETYWQNADITDTHGAETDSYLGFVDRVRRARHSFDTLPNGTYVAFTHGMWLGMLMWQLMLQDDARIMNMRAFRQFELTIRPNNCEIFRLDYAQGAATISKQRTHIH